MRLRHKKVSWREEAKKRAALEAEKHVREGFIVGLGTGSTAAYAIQEIGRRVKQESLRILGVPTSNQARLLAIDCGIPLTTLNEHTQLDLTIDGADQIDKRLNLIKGVGGALTREKIVASASKQLVIAADETELVENLGTNHPLPVEVLPFASATAMLRLREMGGKPTLREGRVGPFITDNGNFIIDVDFGPVNELEKLNAKLKLIPGMIETGLFIEMANIVYLGKPATVQRLERK